jgi:hypothetical protein
MGVIIMHVISLRRCVALALVGLPLALGGCSVGMALSGEETPDLAACRVGANRADVEVQLGQPVSVQSLPDGGQTCTYEYQVGNDPSAGRAIAHGAMDVLTLGLWEAVGTPVEAIQGQKYRMTVAYGPDGKAREITTQKISD